YLCSEAMHGLGIPTTRALALVGSDLPVRRETIETAAVVTRVAPSFIRFGHFEHFAHHGQPEALRQLFEHVVEHFAPQCREAQHPAAALLAWVAGRTAELLADWQAVGFCHGVMNTDNMSILGLTIDYGPFGFLDGFEPGHVCNHSDHEGRYAFARQPQVAHWNLRALAQALVPLLGSDDTEPLSEALDVFADRFGPALLQRLRAKLGLATAADDDGALIDDWLRLMASDRTDYTIAWRRLAQFSSAPGADNAAVRNLFIDRPGFDAWAARYSVRLQAEGSIDAERSQRMNRINPKFVLRNHLAETAIRQAASGDVSEIERLMKVLARPYDEQPEHAAYAGFPPDWAGSLAVSCSS
ncbi:MAG: protein adenylyltransferase SelO family protein, partial [Burkholderiales bacterium]